jgi:hypothetical protein
MIIARHTFNAMRLSGEKWMGTASGDMGSWKFEFGS